MFMLEKQNQQNTTDSILARNNIQLLSPTKYRIDYPSVNACLCAFYSVLSSRAYANISIYALMYDQNKSQVENVLLDKQNPETAFSWEDIVETIDSIMSITATIYSDDTLEHELACVRLCNEPCAPAYICVDFPPCVCDDADMNMRVSSAQLLCVFNLFEILTR